LSFNLCAGSGHRDGQRTDRGGLVDHRQDPPAPGQLVEQLPQSSLGVRQRRVVQPLTGRIQRDRMVVRFADIEPQEHAVLVVHASPLHGSNVAGPLARASDCR
jgi:hypothetical protein